MAKTTKGEESRKRLLTAAEKLFAEQGVHATSVSSIVAEAGLTQAAFYLYFPGKRQLLDALIASFEAQITPFADAGRLAKEHSPEELPRYVASVFTSLFELLGSNIKLTRIVLQHSDAGERLRETIVTQIAANLRKNKALGIVRSEVEPELAAESVVAAAERLTYKYLETGQYTAEQLGAHMARTFLLGVLPH
ncbi:TetR/AcrR family transcriptional regulator [Paenibacillus sp. CN-4]|uniref:TetR/AcrR family transcriptional regulator n=1 Tax=Paenibacillus nanchangensis TaxID=3348343 RepID=UPI00397C0A9F